MFRKNAGNKGTGAITESLRNSPGGPEFIPSKHRDGGIELRRFLAFLVVCLIWISTFAPCVPTLEAANANANANANIAQLRVSYVVQPDRINVPHDKIQEYGYNIRAFQNDDVRFSVYLTNQGVITAENVTVTLEVPGGLGFSLTDDTTYYGDIEPQEISIGNFSFITTNVSSGFYNFGLSVSYQDQTGKHAFESTIVVKVIDVGVLKIAHLRPTALFIKENGSMFEDFLTPIDSVILGYSGIFASNKRDKISISIKNGGNNILENVTLDIIPPANISIEGMPCYEQTTPYIHEGSNNYSEWFSAPTFTLGVGNYKTITVDLITSNISPGIYNLVLKMSYSDDIGVHSLEQMMPIGIYEVTPSINMDSHSEDENMVNLIIDSSVEIVTPHKIPFKISTSRFEITQIPIPHNSDEIIDTIEVIIKKVFEGYMEHSTLDFEKSGWSNPYLVNITNKPETKLIWASILKGLEREFKEEFSDILITRPVVNLLENSTINPALEIETIATAQDAGSQYGGIVFQNTLSHSTIVENFISKKGKDIEILVVKNILEDVAIPKTERFVEFSNILPIKFIEISDEDSQYIIDNTNNIVLDNLPITIKVDISQLRSQYNLTDETIQGSLILSSSKMIEHHLVESQNDIFTIIQAVPQINYRILLYIKTMTVNQHKSKVHDTPRGNTNKNLNT